MNDYTTARDALIPEAEEFANLINGRSGKTAQWVIGWNASFLGMMQWLVKRAGL